MKLQKPSPGEGLEGLYEECIANSLLNTAATPAGLFGQWIGKEKIIERGYRDHRLRGHFRFFCFKYLGISASKGWE